jgi:hypothetical protein
MTRIKQRMRSLFSFQGTSFFFRRRFNSDFYILSHPAARLQQLFFSNRPGICGNACPAIAVLKVQEIIYHTPDNKVKGDLREKIAQKNQGLCARQTPLAKLFNGSA